LTGLGIREVLEWDEPCSISMRNTVQTAAKFAEPNPDRIPRWG